MPGALSVIPFGAFALVYCGRCSIPRIARLEFQWERAGGVREKMLADFGARLLAAIAETAVGIKAIP
jgi:hypothetical protein